MAKKATLLSYTILKWIPRLLILGVVGFSAYVWWNYGKTDQSAERKSGLRGGKKKVVQEVSGIEYSHFDKGLKVYEVRAKKNRKMQNQQQQLDKPVFIFFDDQEKETIRVTGKRCNISRDYNTITVIDDVVVKSQNDMTVTAHLLKYDSRLKQFHTPSPSKFHWKAMNGKSRGFVYKIEEDMLILPEEPQIHYVNKAGENRQPIIVTGMRGAVDRKNGFAYFDENVEVTQGRDSIHADRIEVNFKPGDNDVEKIVARNNVKVKFAKPGKGQDKSQTAVVQPANLETPPVPKGQPPKMSNVFVADQGSGKDLEADTVELFFFEDGSTIKSFRSTGNCTFVLHTFDKRNKPFEDRIIKGDQFDATFDGNGDMEQFHATQNVTVNVQPADPARKRAMPQTIYCQDLNAYFLPKTGDVREIHFGGGFKHVQNNRTVSSQRAIYFGKDGKTDLIGTPQIQDASFNITSDKMFLYEQTSAIHADGNVKSEFIKSEGKTPNTFPFASPSNQPVYISAEKMDWDSHKSEAIYTGKAKLWQEKNVITAAKLTINDKEKTLSAYDKVHTIFYNQKKEEETEEAKDKPKKKEKQSSQPATADDENKFMLTPEKGEDGPISVDAAIMNYVEKDRIIHFEKDVKIVTPSTKINSDKSDFYLMEKSSEFDRLYAQGKVTIQTEQKRGSGKQATFFSSDKKLILEGNPKLQEPGKADILGQVLTLFLADGRILIDGQEDGRATTTLEMLEGSTLTTPKSATAKTATSKTAKSKTATPKPTTKKAPNAGSKDGKPNQKL